MPIKEKRNVRQDVGTSEESTRVTTNSDIKHHLCFADQIVPRELLTWFVELGRRIRNPLECGMEHC